MSTQALTELHSSDATERAIAQRVVRILNDRALTRADRERLVRRAQRDLLDHRAAKARRATVDAQAARFKLPEGYVRAGAQVREGRVEVGGLCRGRGFTWFDAGPVATGR